MRFVPDESSRIVVRHSNRDVLVNEPLASPLVESRMRVLAQFYDDLPAADGHQPG